jgi:hypothetical protein
MGRRSNGHTNGADEAPCSAGYERSASRHVPIGASTAATGVVATNSPEPTGVARWDGGAHPVELTATSLAPDGASVWTSC